MSGDKNAEPVSHTPGPWHVAEMNHYGRVMVNSNGWHVCSAAAGVPTGQVEANASLIAAAPDLLESLKEMSAVLHCDPAPSALMIGTLSRAYDAIAKAEGRS